MDFQAQIVLIFIVFIFLQINMKAEKVNLEISLFVRQLQSFLDLQNNAQPSDEAKDTDTLDIIVKLLSSYEKRNPHKLGGDDIRNFVDDSNFDFVRYVHCRLCNVSIQLFRCSLRYLSTQQWPHCLNTQTSFKMTQHAFENHIGSEQHKNGGQAANIQQKSNASIAHSESFHSIDGAESIKSQGSFDVTEIFGLIETEATNLLTRTNQRIQSEKEIIAMVSKYVQMYNGRFNVHQYGSTTFGFGGTVDLNILVDTSKFLIYSLFYYHSNGISNVQFCEKSLCSKNGCGSIISDARVLQINWTK